MTSSPTLESISRRRVGVLGYGREGRSVVRALLDRYPDTDITVLIEDGRSPDDLAVIQGPFDDRLAGFDVLLRSPGVPLRHPALIEYSLRGGQVINPSSIWFAERPDLPVAGVTGSKGKSTSAALLAHLLAGQGRSVLLAGNIGVPLLDHLDCDADIVVMELSSYQLADLQGTLSLGLMTRLFPEHLDWHGGMDDYTACKLNMANLLAGRPLIINAADPLLLEATAGVAGRIEGNCPPAICRDGDRLVHGQRELVAAQGLPLVGRHNLDNIALVLAAGLELGLDLDAMIDSLAGFRPLPHRLEPVAQTGGMAWINDSIATSPHATLAALQAVGTRSVTLIVGGKDRPADWTVVIDWCRVHGLHALIALPDNGPAIVDRFVQELGAGFAPTRLAEDMEHAVLLARAACAGDGVVLLSPGAPSFPHFRDFEERGERFAAAVRST